MRIVFFLLTGLGLAACQPTPEVSRNTDACGAAEMEHLIGIPRTSLENIAFSQPHRILPEGSAMTMDFIEQRVNFSLDENDEVVRIWCG